MKNKFKKFFVIMSVLLGCLTVSYFSFRIISKYVNKFSLKKQNLNFKSLAIELVDNFDLFDNIDYNKNFDVILNLTNDLEIVLNKKDEINICVKLVEIFNKIKNELSNLNLSVTNDLRVCCNKLLNKVNKLSSFNSGIKKEIFDFNYDLKYKIEYLKKVYKRLKDFINLCDEEFRIFEKQEVEIGDIYNESNDDNNGSRRELKIGVTRERFRVNQESKIKSKESVCDFVSFSLPIFDRDEEILKSKGLDFFVDEFGVKQYPNLRLEIFDEENNESLFSSRIVKKNLQKDQFIWYSEGDFGNSEKTFSSRIVKKNLQKDQFIWYSEGDFGNSEKTIESYKNYILKIYYDSYCILNLKIKLGKFEKLDINFIKLSLKNSILNSKV